MYKMQQALEIVRSNPGCTKLFVAKLVGPHGSLRYGYAIVDRCIRRRMITARAVGNKYSLQVKS